MKQPARSPRCTPPHPWRHLRGLLLLALLPLAEPALATGSLQSSFHGQLLQPPGMKWSGGEQVDRDLADWQRLNASQLSVVQTAWAALLRRMRGHLPAQFGRQCRALGLSLEQLDETILLPVPDRLVDLYMRRLLRHLHRGATACRAGELFNVVYHLEEARSALGEVRWLLATRHDTTGHIVAPPTPP